MAAMRFVKHKVALDIVTGKERKPQVIEHDGWKILRVTHAQLEDYQTCREVMRQLSQLLKSSAHQQEDFDDHVLDLSKLMLDHSA